MTPHLSNPSVSKRVICIPKIVVHLALFSCIATASAQTTNTNTVTNGGVINVGDTQIITNVVSSPISAAITNDGSLQFWQTTALTVSGVISGSGTLTKASGSGNLTLSGDNTFSGKVTVSGGTLIATSVADSGASSLGTGTQLELGQGANLDFTASSNVSTARELVLSGTSGLSSLRSFGAGAVVWSGNVVNQTTTTATFTLGGNGSGNNEFAGVISNGAGSLRLIKTGTGNWKLTGANTFSGAMDVFDGTLQATTIGNIGEASSLGAGSTIRFGGFTGNAPVLEYIGSGSTNNRQIKLGGGGTGDTGGTILNNGSGALAFTNATFNTVGDGIFANTTRALSLGGTNADDNTISGTIQDNNSGATKTNNVVSVVKIDAGKWILAGSNTYTGGTVISNGTLQIGAGGTSGSVLGAISNDASLVFNRSDAVTVTNAISGSGEVIKASGSGNLTLSGNNTFSGKVTVSGGTLNATSVADSGASSLGTGTQLELGQGAILDLTASSNVSTARELVLSGTSGLSSLRSFGAGAVVWSGNVVNQTTTTATFTLAGNGSGNNEFAGVISNGAGSLRLIKTGTGNWKLTGANTYSGTMDVFDGTLQATTIGNIGEASSLGAGSTIRFGGFTGNAPVLEYIGSGSTNNRQIKLGGGGTGNTGGAILNNGSGALAFTNATFNTVGDGTFANTTRALTLGGSNTADNTIGGTIQDNNSGANTNNVVSVVKIDAGSWYLGGSNSFTGALEVNAGLLGLNSSSGGAAASVASVSIATNATLLVSVSGQVNDTASVTLSGGTIQRASGVSEVFGDLNVSGSGFLDYGADTGAGTLRFGTYTPSALLSVQNFLPGNKLQFGNSISSSDLSNTNLFQFSNQFTTGTESGFFTITAIPEPSTLLAAGALLALFLAPSGRRLFARTKTRNL
jgi:fibronectin-binding autotransporter adhesin